MEAALLSRTPISTRPETGQAQATSSNAKTDVKTEEPTVKTVEPANDAEPPRNEVREERAEPRQEAELDRRNILDTETNTFIFQAVNVETGEVERQLPDDALLNVREYVRSAPVTNQATAEA